MFNRSKKYILLLLINIFCVIVYFNYQESASDDPIDIDYLLSVLEQKDALASELDKLDESLSLTQQTLSNNANELAQTKLKVTQEHEKLETCEIDKAAVIETSKAQIQNLIDNQSNQKQVSNCDSQIVELSLKDTKIASLQKRVNELQISLAKTESELLSKNQTLEQIYAEQAIEADGFKAQIENLKQALVTPIRLEKNYIGAKFCEKPSFESRMCVEEFLVRPMFSKPPIGQLTIRVFDPNSDVVASGEFNQDRTQLYRLSLRRAQELAAGMYKVEYRVDNQVLLSDANELSQ